MKVEASAFLCFKKKKTPTTHTKNHHKKNPKPKPQWFPGISYGIIQTNPQDSPCISYHRTSLFQVQLSHKAAL